MNSIKTLTSLVSIFDGYILPLRSSSACSLSYQNINTNIVKKNVGKNFPFLNRDFIYLDFIIATNKLYGGTTIAISASILILADLY